MMKEHKTQIVVGIAVLILTFLLALQFKSVTLNNEANQTFNMRVDELASELKKERETNDDLNKQIEAYKNDIAQYRADAEQSSGYSNFLSDQLKRAELMAGFVDVKGPGITITLSDMDNRKAQGNLLSSNDTLIHDEDLRRVINELCAAGAEAICVNDSRIISTSAIRCVGPTILVNDTKMAPPYVIKAIGKTNQLEAAMNLNGGVIDNLEIWGFTVQITKSSELIIPKYSGAINFSSATAVETTQEGGD
ncbi:MAG: DUF881 domain-containing protein [Clostridia bacterium]|nr:DUF881 domain-containing protein [Clostridia bacterium]